MKRLFLYALASWAILVAGCQLPRVTLPPWGDDGTVIQPTPPPAPEPPPTAQEPPQATSETADGETSEPECEPAYGPLYGRDGAIEIKCNRWNPETSKGKAKVLFAEKYRGKISWVTLVDGTGHQERLKHATPNDAGNRPRWYASRPGRDYVGPVVIRAHIPSGQDVVCIVADPAKDIK